MSRGGPRYLRIIETFLESTHTLGPKSLSLISLHVVVLKGMPASLQTWGGHLEPGLLIDVIAMSNMQAKLPSCLGLYPKLGCKAPGIAATSQF